jgi:3-phenylpropionate/trans-cinnamate dioxygenase ferredoxin subunit
LERKLALGTLQEMGPGTKKMVRLEGKSIGVFNINGRFFALRNVCPHQGAPLCEGLVTPLVTSSVPGHFEWERDGEIIRCPWHQWEFDIQTGCMIVDPKTRTKTYDVTVEKFDVTLQDDVVMVSL